MGKFTGIDEILQGGAPAAPSRVQDEKCKETMAKTSLEYPLELHRKVKKYAIDTGMKEKQVIALAVKEFSEKQEKNNNYLKSEL